MSKEPQVRNFPTDYALCAHTIYTQGCGTHFCGSLHVLAMCPQDSLEPFSSWVTVPLEERWRLNFQGLRLGFFVEYTKLTFNFHLKVAIVKENIIFRRSFGVLLGNIPKR